MCLATPFEIESNLFLSVLVLHKLTSREPTIFFVIFFNLVKALGAWTTEAIL
jgi:hypothetical protein